MHPSVVLCAALATVFGFTGTSHAQRIAATDRLEFENHGCYGTCPVYEATIFADGRVRYRGLEFVQTYGDRWRKISQGRARRLIRRVAKTKNGRTRAGVTDQVVTSTLAHIGGRQYRVRHNHGWGLSPKSIGPRRLERRIRRAIGARRLASGPTGCHGKATSASLVVPRGSSRYGSTELDAVERAFFERVVRRLSEDPRSQIELWVAAPTDERDVAVRSLRAVRRALVAQGISPQRFAWTAVVAEDTGASAASRRVYLRGTSPRCVAPPP